MIRVPEGDSGVPMVVTRLSIGWMRKYPSGLNFRKELDRGIGDSRKAREARQGRKSNRKSSRGDAENADKRGI
jgi:hypothetical protein